MTNITFAENLQFDNKSGELNWLEIVTGRYKIVISISATSEIMQSITKIV